MRKIWITLVPDWQQAPKDPYASWLFEPDVKSLTSQSNKTSKLLPHNVRTVHELLSPGWEPRNMYCK